MAGNNPTGINQYTKSGSKSHGIKKLLNRNDFPYGSTRNPGGRKSSANIRGMRPSTALAFDRVIKRVKTK